MKTREPGSNDIKAQHRHVAETLSEALPFMRRFNGQTFVIKYGGHAMGDAALARQFAHDIVLIKQVGIHPIIVHGGGPQIGDMLKRLEIQSDFVDGLRVTDRATMEIAEMVLSGGINKQIVSAINEAGGKAIGLSGKDGHMIKTEKLQRLKRDPDSNIEKVVDLGFVGSPKSVDAGILRDLTNSGIIPVIAPIGVGEDGETYNINADTAAGAVAAAVNASKLILLTDVAGILDKAQCLVVEADRQDVTHMIENGIVTGGMIPKVETCLSALDGGVGAATILDGRIPHVLLVEIFTEGGVGTMITQDSP